MEEHVVDDPAGRYLPPNPSELLGSDAARAVLTELRTRYDMIVIDTPPLLPVTDGAVMAALADGVILVVREGKDVPPPAGGVRPATLPRRCPFPRDRAEHGLGRARRQLLDLRPASGSPRRQLSAEAGERLAELRPTVRRPAPTAPVTTTQPRARTAPPTAPVASPPSGAAIPPPPGAPSPTPAAAPNPAPATAPNGSRRPRRGTRPRPCDGRQDARHAFNGAIPPEPPVGGPPIRHGVRRASPTTADLAAPAVPL